MTTKDTVTSGVRTPPVNPSRPCVRSRFLLFEISGLRDRRSDDDGWVTMG